MLDSETEKGKQYIQNEKEVADAVCRKMKCSQILMARNDSQVDRLFYRNEQLVAIGEIKTRNLSLHKLQKLGSYLITHQKIKMGQAFSSLVGVPYFLFVKLLEDGDIYFWKICDKDGEFCIDYDVKTTATAANINGGYVERENAFLSLNYMERLIA